jgi:uncharacterized protein YkwD
MKKHGLAVSLIIPIILLCTSAATAALYSDWHPYEQQVFELVNLQRSHHGLTALIADSRLQAAADLHSQDMAQNDFFSHTGSNGSLSSERITAQQYDWDWSGENIAAGYANPLYVMYGTDNLQSLSAFDLGLGHDGFADWDEVGQDWTQGNWVDWAAQNSYGGGWMGSTGHRENILGANFTDIGVGYYYLETDTGGTNYSYYWTQDFASGDTTPPAVPIPAAILLFGSGLFGIAGIRRYNR